MLLAILLLQILILLLIIVFAIDYFGLANQIIDGINDIKEYERIERKREQDGE